MSHTLSTGKTTFHYDHELYQLDQYNYLVVQLTKVLAGLRQGLPGHISQTEFSPKCFQFQPLCYFRQCKIL